MDMVDGKRFQVIVHNADGTSNAEYFTSHQDANEFSLKHDRASVFEYTKKPRGYFNELPKAYWWTYLGVRGGKCHLMSHHSEDSAEFHHNAAKTIGFFGDTLGRSMTCIDEATAVAQLSNRFSGIEIVNPHV